MWISYFFLVIENWKKAKSQRPEAIQMCAQTRPAADPSVPSGRWSSAYNHHSLDRFSVNDAREPCPF